MRSIAYISRFRSQKQVFASLTPHSPQFALYAALCRLADRNGTCEVSHDELMQKCGLPRITLRRAANALRDSNAIDWKRTGRGNRWYLAPAEYDPIAPNPANTPASNRSPRYVSHHISRYKERGRVRKTSENYSNQRATTALPAARSQVRQTYPAPTPQSDALADRVIAALIGRQRVPIPAIIRRKVVGRTDRQVRFAFAEFDRACKRAWYDVGLFLTILAAMPDIPDPAPSPPAIAVCPACGAKGFLPSGAFCSCSAGEYEKCLREPDVLPRPASCTIENTGVADGTGVNIPRSGNPAAHIHRSPESQRRAGQTDWCPRPEI